MWINQVLPNWSKNGLFSLASVSVFPRLFGVLRFSAMVGEISSGFSDCDVRRTYQVVVAATRDMGIGKDGKLPWRLPSDLKFFKELTLTTSDPWKKNAVVMGRRTWESIPPEYRPLPGRLNVVLTRSGSSDVGTGENLVSCRSFPAALQLLAKAPYCLSVETVFVIGGGQLLREALNAQGCEAIHITEIGTSIDCDTFIPAIDFSCFQPWYSSAPLVENNIPFSFVTYARVRNSATASLTINGEMKSNGSSNSGNFDIRKFDFLPKMIFERHDEYKYLRLVQEIISSGTQKDDRANTSSLSIFGCQLRFNLHKSFPLLTTKRVCWLGVLKELFCFVHGPATKNEMLDQLSGIINKIKHRPDCRQIILPLLNQSDLKFKFYVVNGELSSQIYQGSADMGLGFPCNIASYALLTCIIAHVCGLVPGDLIYVIGDAHIDQTHIRPLQKQLQKLPRPFPILRINPQKKDIDSFVASDFELLGYDPHLED
ncbi:hypothetical protein SLE2022_099410 [Rubroshorea leprosula]